MPNTFAYIRPPLTGEAPGKPAKLQEAIGEPFRKTVEEILGLKPAVIFHSNVPRAQTAIRMLDASGIKMIELPELHIESSADAETSRLLIEMKKRGGQALITYIQAGHEAALRKLVSNIRQAARTKLEEAGFLQNGDWDRGKRVNICFLGHMPLLSACIWFNPLHVGLRASELKGFSYGYAVRPSEAFVFTRDDERMITEWKLISPHH